MIKLIFKSFFKQYLYFLSIVEVFRIFFFLYYFDKTSQQAFGDVVSSFYYGFLLDNSANAYMMVLPFFLYLLYSVWPVNLIWNVNRIYTYIMTVLLIIIETSNIFIYGEWGMKLNYKAISYLSEPGEALHSARISLLILGFLIIVAFSFLWIWGGHRLMVFARKNVTRVWWFSLIWFVVMPPLIFGSMRGSLQQIPIIQSQSYHSKSNFVNIASVNTLWNLGKSIIENSQSINENPFDYYPLEEAKKRVAALYDFPHADGLKILTTDRPNVVLIFLESWSGDFIDELGSNLHITKGFSKLAKEGYLFTNHYASGMLSHQGLSAVLSACPSTPFSSVIKQPSKYHGLNCIVKDFKDIGYHTSFLFGGQLIYGNIKAYIYYNEFDKITEGKDFDASVPEGSLGHHDQYMFDRLIKDINGYPQPFFAGAFTLSSHSPFDMPVQNYVSFGGEFNKMLNSIYYSDSCLYNFVTEAKKQPWYDNTLFIFVADHSHPSPFKYPYFSKKARKIPLMFYGNVIKKEYRGKTNNTMMSQTDIAATLLAQVNMPHKKYHWSKDVFNPYMKPSAYFGFDDGYGWIEPHGYYSYHKGLERMMDHHFDSKQDSIQLVNSGKAFIQVLYQEYLDF